LADSRSACPFKAAVWALTFRVARAIDARHERAAIWYERFGALRLLDDPLRLVLPLKTIAEALALAEKA
jgi:hypothetical protein